MKIRLAVLAVVLVLFPALSRAQGAPAVRQTLNNWDMAIGPVVTECKIFLPLVQSGRLNSSVPVTNFTQREIYAAGVCQGEFGAALTLMSLYGDIPYYPEGIKFNDLLANVLSYFDQHGNDFKANMPASIAIRTAVKALYPLAPAGSNVPNTVQPATPPQSQSN